MDKEDKAMQWRKATMSKKHRDVPQQGIQSLSYLAQEDSRSDWRDKHMS